MFADALIFVEFSTVNWTGKSEANVQRIISPHQELEALTANFSLARTRDADTTAEKNSNAESARSAPWERSILFPDQENLFRIDHLKRLYPAFGNPHHPHSEITLKFPGNYS